MERAQGTYHCRCAEPPRRRGLPTLGTRRTGPGLRARLPGPFRRPLAPARAYPKLGGGPPADPARDPRRSPRRRRSHCRRAVPPPLKAAAPAAGELGPGAPPPSGCGLGERRERGGALRPGRARSAF